MEINEYLVKLFRTIKDMENLELFTDTAKLSKTEFRLLREIALEHEQGRDIISSELARRLGVTRSAVSQIVTRLEKENIVVRTSSPSDKKIAYVRFSDKALAVFEEQCKVGNEIFERVVSELGEDKIKVLIKSYDEFLEVFHRISREYKEEANN